MVVVMMCVIMLMLILMLMLMPVAVLMVVLTIVLMVSGRSLRTSLAVDPSGIAGGVVLLLPDGHAMFDFVDNVPACRKCFAPVSATDPHPYRELPECE
jgi:hypothetical protein